MVVIDSSIAFKWFSKNEADFDKALQIWDRHVKKEEIIIVPDLIIYELANAWSTKSNLPLKEVRANLKGFHSANLETISISFDLINKAVVFSRKYQVSVYDAAYAILAKEKKCDLITADEKFVDQVKLKFIKRLKDSS